MVIPIIGSPPSTSHSVATGVPLGHDLKIKCENRWLGEKEDFPTRSMHHTGQRNRAHAPYGATKERSAVQLF